MKKHLLTGLVLFGCGTLHALPVGNPAEASLLNWGVMFVPRRNDSCNPCCYWFDDWSVKMGYYGDFVFNRHLGIDGHGLGQGKVIQNTEISTNAGYLAFNIANRLEAFGTLGASKISMRTNETSWLLAGNAEGRLDWQTRFSWSAGVRATLLQGRSWFLGVEGQYFATDPHLDSYLSFANGQYSYFNSHNKMNYAEWQAGLGLAYAFTCFCPNISIIPYIAGKHSWVRFNTHNFQFIRTGTASTLTIFNLKHQKDWGLAIGATATVCDMVALTVEGRWADEKALYVNGNFRF